MSNALINQLSWPETVSSRTRSQPLVPPRINSRINESNILQTQIFKNLTFTCFVSQATPTSVAESYYSATFGVEAVRCPRKDGEVDEFDNPVSVAIRVDVGPIVSMSVGFLPTSAKNILRP